MFKLIIFSYYYFTDEETREDLDKLRTKNQPIASLTFKINNFTLLQEPIENEYKLDLGFRIKKLILEKKQAYLSKKRNLQGTSQAQNCKFFQKPFFI